MHRTRKRWLLAATCLILAGLVLFCGGMFASSWDFMALRTADYETNTHQIQNGFRDLSIKSTTADIVLLPSEGKLCKVVCQEASNLTHSVSVQEDTLVIAQTDTRTWYDHISLFSQTPTITIYLPEIEYGNLFIQESTGNIHIPQDFHFENLSLQTSTGDVESHASASGEIQITTSTGDIRMQNTSANTINLSVSTGKMALQSVICEGTLQLQSSTGDVQLTDVHCQSIRTTGNTGDLLCTGVIAAETLTVTQRTGNVIFDRCDAAEIAVSTRTGHVKGSLLSDKVFFTESNTGDVTVPQTASGGKCRITTTTGNIQITIAS